MMQRLQLRRDDGAYRTLICGSVCMSAGLSIDGTCVQACGTANAVQGLFPHRISEHMRTPIVEQHNVKFLRPIVRGDSGPNRGVGIHTLAGRGAGKQLQEHFQILECGNHLLNSHDRYEDVGQGKTHAPIAFRLNDHQRSVFRYGKICAA